MTTKRKKQNETRKKNYKATFEEIKNTLDLIENEEIVKFLEEGYDRNISEIAISEGGIGNER